MSEIVNGAGINETHANVKRSRSTFPLKQVVMDTHRFGEYHPHFIFDGVTSDNLPFRSAHSARSYTLKAPLMQDVQMHKDYFKVNLRSILPFQADRIIANPTIGNDVPADAYTNITGFLSKCLDIFRGFESAMSSLDPNDPNYYLDVNTLFLKEIILAEAIFSNGSLLSSLGCNLHDYFHAGVDDVDVDSLVDSYMNSLVLAMGTSKYFMFEIDNDPYSVFLNPDDIPVRANAPCITLHDFLQMIRDDANWKFYSFPSAFNFDPFTTIFSSGAMPSQVDYTTRGDVDVDIARLWVYHLSCAEFFTNDKVDYIYSAELFRQYINSLLAEFFRSIGTPLPFTTTHFSWNGIDLVYDYLSAHYFNEFYSSLAYWLTQGVDVTYPYQYFLTLFGFKRSLRFKDYFTGARTRPLAVGAASGQNSTNVPVVSNEVSVVDISRSIQIQRFLNAVNATGRKFEEYLKGIFGDAPSPDHHNPKFLAHSTDTIFASEVENTGVAQQTKENSVTAVFRGHGNQYEYTCKVDEPCFIIGITSYDIERAYSNNIERSFFTKDRFDMFLPELQYVGDQPVYGKELNSLNTSPNFAYQFRDMDRKQLVNRACGGFPAGRLPGYAFIYKSAAILRNGAVITPDFIRSRNSELDEFYVSLTGYSLATYFHFIVVNYNSCNASRPMAYNPQILG